jgi:flagellar basal body-associated protein FliL
MRETVDPERTDDEEEASQEQEGPGGTATPQASGSSIRNWLLVLLGVSVVGHGVGFTCFRLARQPTDAEPSPEVCLGVFRFAADPAEGGNVTGAEFSLHVALLSQADRQARQALRSKQFRVQQAVEELVRQAHSSDFEDPLLGELKRRLRQQINEILGIRAITDVMITELRLHRDADQIGRLTGTVNAAPRTGPPSG